MKRNEPVVSSKFLFVPQPFTVQAMVQSGSTLHLLGVTKRQ